MKIEIPDLPGNSDMSKKAIVNRTSPNRNAHKKAIVRGQLGADKPTRARITDIFRPTDLRDVAFSVVNGVVIPYIQRLIVDTGTSFLRAVFLGEDAGAYTGSVTPRASRVDYSSIYDARIGAKFSKTTTTSQPAQYASTSCNPEAIELDTYGDAQLLLDQMQESINEDGYVSVSDMFDMAGLTCDHVGNNLGWANISDAKVVPKPNGKYMIKLPAYRSIKSILD